MTSTLTAARISVDIAPPVANISLRNPPLNIIDISMMEQLSQALGEIEARQDISVLVIRGEAKNIFRRRRRCCAFARESTRHARQVPLGDSGDGVLEESDDRLRGRALSRRRCRTRDDLRYGVHRRRCTVGISRDQAGMLSAGGVYSFGRPGRTETCRRIDSDWPCAHWHGSRRNRSGDSRCSRGSFDSRRRRVRRSDFCR